MKFPDRIIHSLAQLYKITGPLKLYLMETNKQHMISLKKKIKFFPDAVNNAKGSRYVKTHKKLTRYESGENRIQNQTPQAENLGLVVSSYGHCRRY